jgi:hypothetical protein
MAQCLFCRTQGNFRTREHIVPESLDNDTDILEGVICSSCQNYFGKEIEKAALEQTPIAFWRSYLGIRTKKKRLPSVNLDPPARGAIPAFHPVSDTGIGFSAHEDGSTSIDVDNPIFIQKLLQGKGKYQMVLSPWHLSIIGRFLGKIGLEYVALTDLDSALSNYFDDIRSFVRYGSTKHLWPIFWGQQGKLGELKGPIAWVGSEGHQEIECYRYALGKIKSGDMLFAFSIGIDIMLICLTTRSPLPEIEKSITGVELSCVYYADGTWKNL